MRHPLAVLALLVVAPLAWVVPAAGDHHDSECPEYDQSGNLPAGTQVEWSGAGFLRFTVPHEGRLYYLTVDEAAQAHTLFASGGGVWLYEETNEMPGLQRHDGFCFEPVSWGYTHDTVIL